MVSSKLLGGDSKHLFYSVSYLLLPSNFLTLAAKAASRIGLGLVRLIAAHCSLPVIRQSPHMGYWLTHVRAWANDDKRKRVVVLLVLSVSLSASAIESIPTWVHNDSTNLWIINDAYTSWEIPGGTNQLVVFEVDGGENPNNLNCYDGIVSQDLAIGAEGLGYFNPQYIHFTGGEFLLSSGLPPDIESQAYSDADAYTDFMLGFGFIFMTGFSAIGVRYVRKAIGGSIESE